jgi:hypothetical protein
VKLAPSLFGSVVFLATALPGAALAQAPASPAYVPAQHAESPLWLAQAEPTGLKLPGSLTLPIVAADATYSSSAGAATSDKAADAPAAEDAAIPFAKGAITRGGALPAGYGNPAFKSIAFALKAGDQGLGFEVATPLARRVNLRGGAQFLSYNAALSDDGVNVDAHLKMLNAFACVDLYPFRNSFHISPGVTMHNDTHLTAALFAPGGSTLTLGNDDYTSDPSDPISGSAAVTMGTNTFAPRLTLGWGNMLPHSGHWAFPIEAGFQYNSAPVVAISLTGIGCDQEGCGDINKNGGAADIQAEIAKYTKDLKPLRFYPILSIGLSYRFGAGAYHPTR